jgi:hypothetical protein
MLKTVRDACEPHHVALDFSPSEQVEDLAQVLDDKADGRAFYAKNHITSGMRQLFELGLKRLAGRNDQAIFELTQAMGGGKTHTMVAFGLLAKNESLRAEILPTLAREAPFGRARVVAFTGRTYPDHFMWGEIAKQLGRGDAFKRYWKDGAEAPDEAAWMSLIGDEPTVLLLDELPPYFDYAVTRRVGDGTLAQVATAALANLFSAALKLPRLCIVISNLSGTYESASKDLRRAIRNVEGEARRQTKAITPVELGGDEIYQILKKRLFASLPSENDVEIVAQEYAKAVKEAEKSKAIAKSTEQIVDEIRGSYPFHPGIKDIIALFRNNESYRQTRGLMQFVSKMIRSVWKRKTNDVYLMGLQHLDLNDSEVRDEVVRISDLQGAIAKDVASGGAGSAHAETIDTEMESDAGSQVATLLLASSLSTAVDAVKGMTRQRLLEHLIAPHRTANEFADAFSHVVREAWYLHRDQSDAYYFSNTENLTKRLATEAERAPQNKVDAEMRRRVEIIFEPTRKTAYQDLKALPVIDEVNLKGPRVLLVLSPDTRNPPVEAQRFYDSVTEKNNLCVLTGDGTDISSLEEKTRVLYAIAKLKEELPESAPQQKELDEKQEAAEQDFNSTVKSTFNRIYYPTKSGLEPTKVAMTFTGNRFDGEEQIEQALASVGVSKLVIDLENSAQAQIKKAEDLLWPAGQKRVPWRDIKARAIANPRWTWLPQNGLDQLKKIAEQQGRWRDCNDGYEEQGPFEAPKTSVRITQLSHDDETGEAVLEVAPINAGTAGQVHYATKADVTTKSTRLMDAKLKTGEVKLWFRAFDPSGERAPGDPLPWSNSLTITHQVRGAGTKRKVELKVVPRGRIRYTLTGANPSEGTTYTAPIDIDGKEVTVFCHAEADGVTATRQFIVPAAGDKEVRIDPAKPAVLRKRLEAEGTPDAFRLIGQVKSGRARLRGARIEVGVGEKTAILRFGNESAVTPEAIEALVGAMRKAIGDDMAEVQVGAGAAEFSNGHDLSEFIRDRGIALDPNEVEQ